MKLANKFAFVTGASQGLGFAIVHRFVQEGAGVLLCARTASNLGGRGTGPSGCCSWYTGPGMVERADVSSEADVGRLAEIISKQFVKLDILVSNAVVVGPKGAIEEVNWAAWTQTIGINLFGTVLCCRTFLPLLRKSARGRSSSFPVEAPPSPCPS
jgi:3-oxoacyl-[acyl-carrier protein] reductase